MRFLFAFLLLTSLVLAQQPQPGQPAEPPKKARIEGVVVSITGEPIPRAQIRLTGAPSLEGGQLVTGAAFAATSDDAGKFAIDGIDPGRAYQLGAQRTGFVPARYGARSTNSPNAVLALEAGQVLKGVTLTMTPQGVISGRVLDPSGDPQQNVMVVLLRRGYQRGVRAILLGNTASTNDQGEFRIPNLAPGRYYLVAQDRSFLQGVPASSNASLATYYPNAIDFQGAAPLDVTAGQELRGMEVRLRQGKSFTITGKAVGPNGEAAPQGTFLLPTPKTDQPSAFNTLFRTQAQIRADGTFEIRGITPGAYVLQAVSSQPTGSRAAGRMEVSVTDADVSGIVFPLVPAAAVNGTVTLEGGDLTKLLGPSPGANAQQAAALAVLATSAGVPLNGARTTITLAESSGQPIISPQPGVVKDDGSFTIEGVAPVKYLLNLAALPPGTYIKSARLNGSDVTSSELDLTQSSGGTLQIVLSNKAADVTGAVRNNKGESVTGVIVSLWSREPDRGNPNNGVRTATSDQNGTFQFQNLRPGTYYAAAWDDIDSGLALTRDFLTLLTSDATKLDLNEGSHAATELKLIPVAKIKAAEEKLP